MNPTLQILEELSREVRNESSKYVGTNVTFPTNFIFVHSIERVRRNLRSLQVLISDNIFENDHGIGLSIRNVITDLFVVTYLKEFTSYEEELTTMAYNLFNDDLEKIEQFVRDNEGYGDVPPDASKKDLQNRNVEGTLPNLIKENGTAQFPSTTKIFKRFKANKEKELHPLIINAYDMWSYYSKYEHIGWYSYDVTRAPLTEPRKNLVIFKGIAFAIISLKISFLMLKNDGAFKKFTEIQNKVDNAVKEYKKDNKL